MWVIFNLNNDSTQSPKITLQIIHLFFKRVRHNHTSVFSTLCTQQNTTRLSSSVYEIGEHIWGTFDNSAKHNLFRSLLVYYPLLFKPQMINLVQVWILNSHCKMEMLLSVSNFSVDFDAWDYWLAERSNCCKFELPGIGSRFLAKISLAEAHYSINKIKRQRRGWLGPKLEW